MTDELERRFGELVEGYVREQQAALRQRARITRRAAETTVEAVRYELRTYGIAQLAKPRTQARLADFNARQITEMVASLRRMRPRYPAITEELITAIEELKNG
jgi:N-acetyl-anhydromuramyl-L-alanine amidase AmpD